MTIKHKLSLKLISIMQKYSSLDTRIFFTIIILFTIIYYYYINIFAFGRCFYPKGNIQLLHIMLSYNHDYKNQHLKHPTTIMY